MKRPHIPAVHRARRGFTLLEVLIVLAILGVIAAMVVPQLIGTQQTANENATQLSIKNIESALKVYAVGNRGEYPQGGQEVLEMLTLPSTDPVTGRERQPYLESIPYDAWNNPFYYEYPNTKFNIDKPAIWSSGRDGKNDEGAGDDLNNWAELMMQ